VPGECEDEDGDGDGDDEAGAKSAGSCSRSGSSAPMSSAGGGSIAGAPSSMIRVPNAEKGRGIPPNGAGGSLRD
jgi:hypothetical protein